MPKRLIWVLLALLGILILVWPFWGTNYSLRLITMVFMYATMAAAWNLIGGFAGYASFGNVVFFGLGGYGAGVMMARFGWPLISAIVLGIIVCSLLAIVMWPILRLKGHYFAIATLAVAEATKELVSTASITGGSTGLGLPIFPGEIRDMAIFFYFAMFVLMVLTILITYVIRYNRIGYALIAIKVDEQTAESLGVDTARYKTLAFVMSAAITSVAGSLYAYWITFIDPVSMFTVNISINMIMMALLGGTGTIWGPIAGAAVLSLVSEWTWSNFPTLHTSILGLIMVLLILFVPQGLSDLFRKRGNLLGTLRSQLRSYGV